MAGALRRTCVVAIGAALVACGASAVPARSDAVGASSGTPVASGGAAAVGAGSAAVTNGAGAKGPAKRVYGACFSGGDPVSVRSCFVLRACALEATVGTVKVACGGDAPACAELETLFRDAAVETGATLPLSKTFASGGDGPVTLVAEGVKVETDESGAALRALFTALKSRCPKTRSPSWLAKP